MHKHIPDSSPCKQGEMKWAYISGNVIALVYPPDKRRPFGSDAWFSIREIIIFRDKGICAYCGVFCDAPPVDHITPRSKGGLDTLENLTTACPDCNHSKGHKDLSEWMAGRTA